MVNMNTQNEYKIMVLFAIKNPSNASACAMKALLPRQQNVFYEEFKKSVQIYKDRVGLRVSTVICCMSCCMY